jgi:hypothetical protein
MKQEKAKCTLCSPVESSGFYTGCMIQDRNCRHTEWNCDGNGNLTRKTDEELFLSLKSDLELDKFLFKSNVRVALCCAKENNMEESKLKELIEIAEI